MARYPAAVGKAFQGIVDERGQGGTIFYFQYRESPKDVASFLRGYLWGDARKPSPSHPEIFGTCGKMLVIWLFDQDSLVQEVSRKKIEAQMGEAVVMN